MASICFPSLRGLRASSAGCLSWSLMSSKSWTSSSSSFYSSQGEKRSGTSFCHCLKSASQPPSFAFPCSCSWGGCLYVSGAWQIWRRGWSPGRPQRCRGKRPHTSQVCRWWEEGAGLQAGKLQLQPWQPPPPCPVQGPHCICFYFMSECPAPRPALHRRWMTSGATHPGTSHETDPPMSRPLGSWLATFKYGYRVGPSKTRPVNLGYFMAL